MIDSIKTYIMDILSLFVPGAVAFAILGRVPAIDQFFIETHLYEYEGWVHVAKFLVLIYILGHFLFFFGSLLDDWVYDKLKDSIWKNKSLQDMVVRFKIYQTGIADGDTFNAFKWCSAWLLIHQPKLYEQMERHMAESKFFRSLVVVGLLAVAIFGSQSDLGLALVSLLVTAFSLVRYMTQRKKSVDMAYQGVITASVAFKDFVNKS
jgi:hypothetical protein